MNKNRYLPYFISFIKCAFRIQQLKKLFILIVRGIINELWLVIKLKGKKNFPRIKAQNLFCKKNQFNVIKIIV